MRQEDFDLQSGLLFFRLFQVFVVGEVHFLVNEAFQVLVSARVVNCLADDFEGLVGEALILDLTVVYVLGFVLKSRVSF
jgi:hypothetical protein